jgi:uncharacterized surface protein with fasciclin (FAS1) repeats
MLFIRTMNKFLLRILPFLTLVVLLVNCRKKEWDEYYARPENLEPPIYQVLQSKSNFTQMVACIEKAGYKDILGKAGYWTLFAPTDSAFQQFYLENGFKGIEQVDSLTAQKIVRYCLAYNSFNQERLDDFQGGKGWEADLAFKRRSAYYELFDTATYNGQTIDIVASNRNGGYISIDNNNKHIPYFMSSFFTKNLLTAYDYNYFYPNSVYTGFNIMDAKVVSANIPAENGTIHAIDRVLLPLPNIEKYLASKPEYSLFKSLFERFMTIYMESAEASERFQVLNGAAKKVYVKFYNPLLAFALNNENYLKASDNDAQSNSWTLFAPKNDVLESFLKNVVLEHYGKDLANLDKLPMQIIVDLLNAHMWQAAAWPSKFSKTANYLGEAAMFDDKTDISDKKVLSNGLFYGTNKVQESNLFYTVYARPYLDPKYTLMTRLLNTDLRPVISNTNFKYTIIMLSDEALQRLGYNWDGNRSAWTLAGSSADPKGDLLRLANMHIIPMQNDEPIDFGGSGIVETYGGEMIKYDNNKIYSAGNLDSSLVYTIDVAATKNMKNGVVYYAVPDSLIALKLSTKAVGLRLEELATDSNSPYHKFFQYLKNTTMWNNTTKAITGVPLGFFGTFLIPDNDAIDAAVNAGLLPGTGTAPNKVPNFAPADAVGKTQVSNFIQYHILKKSVIVNGKVTDPTESLYRSLDDEIGFVTPVITNGVLTFKDVKGKTASLNVTNSNVLADRVVFHSINTYLEY